MRLPIVILGLVLLLVGGLAGVAGLALGSQLCENLPERSPFLPNIPTCNELVPTILGLWAIAGLLFVAGLATTIIGAVLEGPKPVRLQALPNTLVTYANCPGCGRVYAAGQYAFCPACGRKVGS